MSKKIIAILMLLTLIALTACGAAPGAVPTVESVEQEDGATGTPQFLFPKSYAWFLGKMDYAPLGASNVPAPSGDYPIPPEFGESAMVQGNKIILTATDEQRAALAAQTDLLLSQAVDAWMNLNPEYTFQNAEDYSSLVFGMDESYSAIDVEHQIEETNLILTILYMVHSNHILVSGDSDITTEVKLVNYHSEKTAQEFSYPTQSLELAAIQWEETY